MKKNIIFGLIITLFCTRLVLPDGLLLPSEKGYPADFLRNRVTEISVKINGLVAETVVYQEFINEWNQTTNAVYSFPLPPDARATALYYMRNDTLFKAVLKVKEQSTNPGTGEGGVAALVNKYIGRNGIKLELLGIDAGAIQKVELHYISNLEYSHGNYVYKYPLNTGDFVKYPLEHFEFNVEVNSARTISEYDIPGHPEFQTLSNTQGKLKLRLRKPGTYPNSDLTFTMKSAVPRLNVDFYSSIPESMSGHFAMFLMTPSSVTADSTLNTNLIFLLSAANTMAGYKLQQSAAAISHALDMLKPNDNFNIMTYTYNLNKWKNNFVPATKENIDAAKVYLSSITTGYGSDLENALLSALNSFGTTSFNNSIVAFTDGRSYINPRTIESKNSNKAGIFPIGIGNDLDFERLEMTAALNYGFVTYFSDNDNIKDGLITLLSKVSKPLIKNPQVNFRGQNIIDFVPDKLSTLFSGSSLYIGGRFMQPAASALDIVGSGPTGVTGYEYQVDFKADTSISNFPALLWAKTKIDQLERIILISGETPELKDSLIRLSLAYQIRCRYTAYIADYSEVIAEIRNEVVPDQLASYIEGNYPNPFNPSTNIKFFIDKNSASKIKLLKIYNILGQLVSVIDVSAYGEGWHTIKYSGKDFFGNMLPSGVYIVSMFVDNQIQSSIKINLIK